MEVEIVLEKEETSQTVLEITAKLMVNGEIGVLGLIVEMIVRKQDPDHVTILPQ